MKHSKSELTDDYTDEVHSDTHVNQRSLDAIVPTQSSAMDSFEESKQTTKRSHVTRCADDANIENKISTPAKRKRANKQIIYVMPGPVDENVRVAHT